MHISFEQTLKVSDIYNLGRYGQFNVSSERLFIPTNQFVAGSQEALALAEINARNTLLVDDGETSQNLDDIPFPVGGLSHNNPLRLGNSMKLWKVFYITLWCLQPHPCWWYSNRAH